MKLERFKEKDNKRIGIIVFTIACILLVCGVILYRTFAIFEVKTNQNVINGTVQDPGDIYFAFYKDDQIQKNMPTKEEGYVLDETKSYCGVTGQNDSDVKEFVTEDNMIHVSGVTTSRTKCTLYFVKGGYILGKGVPIVESGEGLYEVNHEEVSEVNEGFKETEYRYAGSNPNNYVNFNGEQWRIIGLVNVMASESTVEQRVKIIRKESIGSFSWNYNINESHNNWTKATLMEMLNGIYYNSTSGECWTGDNSSDSSQSTCNFNEIVGTKGLEESARNMLDKNIIWNIERIDDDWIVASSFYSFERRKENDSSIWPSNNIIEDTTFNGIGLLYPSDYVYALGNENRNNCLSTNLNQWAIATCLNDNWLTKDKMYWTLTSYSSLQNNSSIISNKGYIMHQGNQVNKAYDVYPTLYLKTNVKILNDSNNGSLDNPYNLAQLFKYK